MNATSTRFVPRNQISKSGFLKNVRRLLGHSAAYFCAKHEDLRVLAGKTILRVRLVRRLLSAVLKKFQHITVELFTAATPTTFNPWHDLELS